MSPGYNSIVPMRDHLLSSPKTLLPLNYQFCLYVGPPADGGSDVGWIETGIAVTVSWTCATDAIATSFDLVYAHETTSFAAHSSVVSIVLKSSLPSLPGGGVLVITGLKGSLTPDTDSMEVQGSAVREEQHRLSCLGSPLRCKIPRLSCKWSHAHFCQLEYCHPLFRPRFSWRTRHLPSSQRAEHSGKRRRGALEKVR